jgi:hypothetical protein
VLPARPVSRSSRGLWRHQRAKKFSTRVALFASGLRSVCEHLATNGAEAGSYVIQARKGGIVKLGVRTPRTWCTYLNSHQHLQIRQFIRAPNGGGIVELGL